MSLDATIGGADSDSYVATAAEALTVAAVLDAIPGLGVDSAGFVAMTTDVQEAVLRMAADRVDRAAWDGVKSNGSQARAVPRTNLQVVRFNDVVPDAVKQAQVADACFLASSQTTAAAQAASGVQSFTVAEESVTFSASAQASAGQPFSSAAESILRGAGLLSSRVGSVWVGRA